MCSSLGRVVPVCWPGYSGQATAHPATCLCLFAGQATLPRLMHTLPPACLPVCWPAYSAQASAHPTTFLLGAQDTLPRLLNTLPPTCHFAGQATLRRLMQTLPPACLPVCWQGYSA